MVKCFKRAAIPRSRARHGLNAPSHSEHVRNAESGDGECLEVQPRVPSTNPMQPDKLERSVSKLLNRSSGVVADEKFNATNSKFGSARKEERSVNVLAETYY